MSARLEVIFAADRMLFPAGHLSRLGGSFDGTLAAAAIRDADPAATPPQLRTRSGEILFVSAGQRAELERFCRDSGVPAGTHPDVWGDLLEPFLDTQTPPEQEAATRGRLHQARLTDADIDQIRAGVGPLMLRYNAVHWEWFHLGLADLLDAAVTFGVPGHQDAGPREMAGFYAWTMRVAGGNGPRPGH